MVAAAERDGASAPDLEELRREYDVATRLRELIARQRAREAELSALYDTASDLTAIRDLDAILAAIVRRARQLLNADMTYLSLNDETEGASYMRVTDGALTPEFRSLRLPLGTGLLGLVAQTGAPYFTEDYQADDRFVHREYIDDAVAGERIRAILGVPLVVDGRVIGALLAVHRSVRPFPPSEVSLLTSFAAHAAVALENARLFAELDAANRAVTEHASAVEGAAVAHDRLTDLLLHGGGVDEVARVLAEVLGGDVAVHDPAGELIAGSAADGELAGGRRRGRRVRPLACRPAACTSPPRWPAPSTSPPWSGTAPRSRSPAPSAAPSSGARWSPRWSCSSPAPWPRPRTASGRRCSRTCSTADAVDLGLRERARRQHVVLDPPLVVAVVCVRRRWTGTPRSGSLGRLAAAERGLAGEYAGRAVLLVPGDDPLAVGERAPTAAAAPPVATATVGVARRRGRPPRRARRGPTLPGHPAHPRPHRRGQRPRRARPDPAAARRERPRAPRRLRRRHPRPGRGVRRGAAAPACWRPSRRGSPPAAGSRTPPNGCTSTPTPSPSGWTGSATLLGPDWRDPGARPRPPARAAHPPPPRSDIGATPHVSGDLWRLDTWSGARRST